MTPCTSRKWLFQGSHRRNERRRGWRELSRRKGHHIRYCVRFRRVCQASRRDQLVASRTSSSSSYIWCRKSAGQREQNSRPDSEIGTADSTDFTDFEDVTGGWPSAVFRSAERLAPSSCSLSNLPCLVRARARGRARG